MPFADPQGVPLATYRLQLRQEFPLPAATAVVPYLHRLGISHAYCSPVLLSTPGSTHGYDVMDYRRIDPELGGRAAFEEFARTLQAQGMAILLDFVPNHMGINGGRNPWWLDVLECGPHSPFAEYFDIDWGDPGQGGRPRVLVPILDRDYGLVLDEGRLALGYDAGEFFITYESMRFPVSPATYAEILGGAAGAAVADPRQQETLAELAELFRALPAGTAHDEPIGRRRRDDLKRQLAAATAAEPATLAVIEAELTRLNGRRETPSSFDAIDALINDQHYRLAHWKTGVHEVNYRRFFAIDSLIGLRMENPRVFEEAHRLVAGLMRDGLVAGLRIDHVDGLRDPAEYLERLQGLPGTSASGPLYVVVEKILGAGEELPSSWFTHGTTGYEFISLLAQLFVDRSAEAKFTRLYQELTGEAEPVADVIYAQKRVVLEETFANAVNQLGQSLAHLVSADRRWRDLTRHELTLAIREIMAELDVYRTYRRLAEPCREEDQLVIERAATAAMRRNSRRDRRPFEFIRDVLVGRYPPAGADAERRDGVARWVLTWQQYTGAVMAKAVEDTTFYVYNRFIALNEVGGHPGEFGGSLAEFHATAARRRTLAPQALLATSTHDTKWGEDLRARLYVLSELPDAWADWVAAWRRFNQPHQTRVDGRWAPDANEEYRLYQTLAGCWPPDAPAPDDALRQRIREHLRKAVNEARRNTHWVQPNEPWLEACDHFVDSILNPATAAGFLAHFLPRVQRLAHLGLVNSLAQVTLKCTIGGVPDFYQGAERWNFSLVDPDNRQLIDWTAAEAEAAAAWSRPWRELLRDWTNGGIKLRLTRELLAWRQAQSALLQSGTYEPVHARGRFAEHVLAFRRRHEQQSALVVVPRLSAFLGCPPLGLVWEDTALEFAATANECWRDVLTGRIFEAGVALEISALFEELPLAVLDLVTGQTENH